MDETARGWAIAAGVLALLAVGLVAAGSVQRARAEAEHAQCVRDTANTPADSYSGLRCMDFSGLAGLDATMAGWVSGGLALLAGAIAWGINRTSSRSPRR